MYGIIKQSGGAIAVDSEAGQGCTFRIYLPAERGRLDEARPKTVAPVEEPLKTADTILVVEDEEIVRELVCQVLSAQGYNVLCAQQGGGGAWS